MVMEKLILSLEGVSKNLNRVISDSSKRLKEVEQNKYDEEIEKLIKMSKNDIVGLYKNRKIEAEEGDLGGD